MSEAVLDASALLALLNAEEGAKIVQEYLPKAVISSVNLAEVVTRLAAVEIPEGEIQEILTILGLEVIPLNRTQAIRTGLLYTQTHSLGLSLGDRACLALAQSMEVPAITADRVWADLNIGIEVKLIR